MDEYNRHELVAAINEVIENWHREHGCGGGALTALDALGYTAGSIFSQAPDVESSIVGRSYFMTALQEGLGHLDIPGQLH
jgi:hypothetical protein